MGNERAQIVAFLRKHAEDDYPGYAKEHLLWWAADAIEAGEHLTPAEHQENDDEG
jgi:hypothetical protein